MHDAITLTEWYLNEALRLSGMAEPNRDLSDAQAVWGWIQDKGLTVVTLPDVYERSIPSVRSAGRARRVMHILTDHGYLVNGNPDKVNPAVPTLDGKKRSKEFWRVAA
jgi:hypothetical protein